MGKAVAGPMTDTPIKVLRSSLTTWKKWKKRFPDTEVLSIDTGYVRDYSRDPYAEYYKRKRGFFSFFKPGPGEEEKALVAGVTIDGIVKAYLINHLRTVQKITDRIGSKDITIIYDSKTDVLSINGRDGNDIPYMIAYWFVWKGIHPDSKLYR
jgi:hypothetical protein